MAYEIDDAALRAISHVVKSIITTDELPEVLYSVEPERVNVMYRGHGGYITRKDAKDWDTSLKDIANALRDSRMESEDKTIDDLIDEWHESDSDLPLHEYLGMTFERYSEVVAGTRIYVDPNPKEDALTEARRIMGIDKGLVRGGRQEDGRRDGMAVSHAILMGWAKRPKTKQGWLELAREYGDADRHPQGNLWWKGFSMALKGQGID